MPPGNPLADVTLVSVVYDDKWKLDLNWELTQRLHPGGQLQWVMAVNQPEQPQQTVPASKHADYHRVQGAVADPAPELSSRCKSVHHADGLNLAQQHVTTRYAVFMDPDCYVVRRGWLVEAMEHMRRHQLAFFGTPYHPRQPQKPRYFPVAFCMMIDTVQIPLQQINWRPRMDALPYSLGDRIARRLLARVSPARRTIGRARDTGIDIIERYQGDRSCRVECVQPVFHYPDHPLQLRRRPPLDWLVPERYSLTPKRRRYFTHKRFADFGLPDFKADGAEEYLWRGKPFAAHLRLGFNRTEDAATQRLVQGIELLTAHA